MSKLRGADKANDDVVINKAVKYLNEFKTAFRSGKKIAIRGETIPSLAGMALYIGISKRALEEKIKSNGRLGRLNNELMALQEAIALNLGLEGKLNRYITGLVLNRHGYKNPQEEIENPTKTTLVIKFDEGNKSADVKEAILSEDANKIGTDNDLEMTIETPASEINYISNSLENVLPEQPEQTEDLQDKVQNDIIDESPSGRLSLSDNSEISDKSET